MRLGIYGKILESGDVNTVRSFLSLLEEQNIHYTIESEYYGQLQEIHTCEGVPTFSSSEDLLAQEVNYLVSLGGDGTLLDTVKYVMKTHIAVLGINFGRLGFLSNIPKESIEEAMYALQNSHYRLERRSLLELKAQDKYFRPVNYGLNDFTIHKRDTGSMISIDTYLNGEFFNTYWADGVIVSTPTGSTAYSLSCGGPIIFPDSNNFVITPVAPHNLNIRPIIVSDSTIISFRVKGRGANHLISLDSRYEIIEHIKEVAIQKAPFYFNLVKLNNQNFIDTLREKLKWGLDTRNF
jgi:NAD+ kinase